MHNIHPSGHDKSAIEHIRQRRRYRSKIYICGEYLHIDKNSKSWNEKWVELAKQKEKYKDWPVGNSSVKRYL